MKIAGDMKRYKELIDYDEKINAAFRGQIRLSGRQRKEYEWKSIKTYRMFQCNRGTFIGKIYKLN